MKRRLWIILTGAVIGGLAVALTMLGNPGNMGFCIACFIRDTAGALGLHSAAAVQTVRPEIIGIVLGAFIAAVCTREFRPYGGSSPITRFLIAVFVMIGALMFLGCPLRMMLRIGGGDLNAVVGLIGFGGGIFVGAQWLKKGFSLKRGYRQSAVEGGIFPILSAVLLIAFVAVPALFLQTTESGGPGALRAPVLIALAAGILVGVLAQRTRFCTVAGGRDAMLFGDFSMLWGLLALIAACMIGNLIAGKFNLGLTSQPVAHTDGIWNFLGMLLVGWGSVYLGGCPLRQLVLAGEGNSDSVITILGYGFGAALCHNFGLASSANGPTDAGRIAVAVGLTAMIALGFLNSQKEKSV